jgi:hypothetical protein
VLLDARGLFGPSYIGSLLGFKNNKRSIEKTRLETEFLATKSKRILFLQRMTLVH